NAALMNAILNNSDFTGSDCSNSRSIGENFKAIDNHGKDIINGKGLSNVCKIHDNV
ncbi:TPA: pentapeptide repeat-containing protein, partial [Escherichia coli]